MAQKVSCWFLRVRGGSLCLAPKNSKKLAEEIIESLETGLQDFKEIYNVLK